MILEKLSNVKKKNKLSHDVTSEYYFLNLILSSVIFIIKFKLNHQKL